MNEQTINKKITYSIVAVLMIVLITIGATYAYFSAEKSTDLQTVTTGTLTMGFTNGNIARATGITPISDSEIKTKATELPFTVTNTGNQHMKLTIKLTDITIADDLKDVDFRWGLYNADTDKGVSFGILKYATTGGEEILLRDVILDAGSPTKNYILRIWIHDDGAEQNYMQGETFSGKVTVTGEAVEYTPENCFTFDSSEGDITGYSDTCPKDVVIPKTIDGVTVTGIGFESDGVFGGMNLNSVIISDTVTGIGSSAFSGNGLTHITIPESVTYIGEMAFSGSGKLSSVIISESVISIEYDAFINNNLKSVVIPGSVPASSGLLASNPIENVLLMDGITAIADNTFYNNYFTSIEIPSSVTRVSEDAFSICDNLTEIVVRGKSSLSDFDYATGLTTDGGLPEGVNIIFRP